MICNYRDNDWHFKKIMSNVFVSMAEIKFYLLEYLAVLQDGGILTEYV